MISIRSRALLAKGILCLTSCGIGAVAGAQQSSSADQPPVQTASPGLCAVNDKPATSPSSDSGLGLPDSPDVLSAAQQSGPASSNSPVTQGKQTKRILYIVPNFRAVSADSHLPPQSVKDKLTTAAEDSFDYSSFIFVGLQAGLGQLNGSYPEFRQGAAGYGRYYWHTFADSTDENLWVEFLIPVALRQDTRYYTLGHGGFAKRIVYAATRIVVTRNDAGSETFNASEVFGAGMAAGISNLYYPAQERTEVKSYQRWVTNISIDGGVFIFKEFWPDINNKFFHQSD